MKCGCLMLCLVRWVCRLLVMCGRSLVGLGRFMVVFC